MMGKDPYTLGIFDTSGQEDYDKLRSLSYPQTDVFLMCFSNLCPDSFESILKKWLPEVHRHCPGVPYILVGITEVEASGERDMREKLSKMNSAPIDKVAGKRMAANIGAIKYMECNLLTQKGLKEIFDEVNRDLNPINLQWRSRITDVSSSHRHLSQRCFLRNHKVSNGHLLENIRTSQPIQLYLVHIAQK
jgi:GTPase SAR1 family protein